MLEDSDRGLIVETLERAGWVVGGPTMAQLAGNWGLGKEPRCLYKMTMIGDLATHLLSKKQDMGGMMPESIEPEDALKPFPQ